MTPHLLQFLCDPLSGEPLELADEKRNTEGQIVSGTLRSKDRTFLIIDGVPRFLLDEKLKQTVVSFGDEWNYFNYDGFKANWLKHIAQGAFGSTGYFRDKLIVDCAAGSGMHAKWMSEYGAKHVICLELSESVDGIMKQNLEGIRNIDVIQCSIDAHPIRPASIEGLVICNAAIQHTPSVERTARALWKMVGPGGELSFSCYVKYPRDPVWMARWFLVYRPLRAVLSRCSFKAVLTYAKIMARLRMLPFIGPLLEKAQFMVRGDVPSGDRYEERLLAQSILNTYDWYGSHQYQHHLSASQLEEICDNLQPRPASILNLDAYYKRPLPPGLPLRLTAENNKSS